MVKEGSHRAYTVPTIIFILLTLSVATATVSDDTIELGVHIANHHFSLFTLSVAIATVSFFLFDSFTSTQQSFSYAGRVFLG